MATIEEFNAVIERAKLKTNFSAVVWTKHADAHPGVTSIQKRKNMIFVFRQVIAFKDTDHAAIIANGHVMAIWHSDTPAGRAELAAGAGDAPLPDNQRYQAEDKDATIAKLKTALEAVQRQLTDVDPEFWYLNVSNALWMIKHALNADAVDAAEQGE